MHIKVSPTSSGAGVKASVAPAPRSAAPESAPAAGQSVICSYQVPLDPDEASLGGAGLDAPGLDLQANLPQALEPSSAALPIGCKPLTGTVSTPELAPAKKKRASRWTPESLAEHRKLKAKVKANIRRAVDDWMLKAENKTYAASYLMVQATGSLCAAAALQAISTASEKSFTSTGNAFVHRTAEEWHVSAGMAADEWLAARWQLREQGLVIERRRFDLEIDEIVTELAFDFEAWGRRLAEIREQAYAHFRDRFEADAGLLQSYFAPT
jgi:hypothetical protein